MSGNLSSGFNEGNSAKIIFTLVDLCQQIYSVLDTSILLFCLMKILRSDLFFLSCKKNTDMLIYVSVLPVLMYVQF